MTSENNEFNICDDDIASNDSGNRHINDVLGVFLSRRKALQGSVSVAAATLLGGVSLAACGGSDTDSAAKPETTPKNKSLNFTAVDRTNADQITIADGYQISILHALGDPMQFGDALWSDKGEETADSYQNRIGDGHDGMYFFGLSDDGKFDSNRSDKGLLCVNHEYVVAPYGLHTNGRTVENGVRPKAEVDKEVFAHGASVVEVRRKAGSNDMEMIRGSKYNRRIHSSTPMEFSGAAKGNELLITPYSKDGTKTRGMNNNCACGYTPWGTYLTCEENFTNVVGRGEDKAKRSAAEDKALTRYSLKEKTITRFAWDTPEGEDYKRWSSTVTGDDAKTDWRNSFNTFGWVVEIDPFRPDSTPIKRTNLGRFKHEGAWPAPAVAGQPIVIYSGDDQANDYIYKYVSDEKWNPADINGGAAAGSKYLDKGTLYVAKFSDDGTGQWVELTYGKNGLNKDNATYPFANQGDILIHARLAGDAVGATPMDRPEWGGVNPLNGEVYMTMTNNSGRKETIAANPRAQNRNGQIIRWRENGAQAATSFVWDIYLFGARTDEKQNENLSGLTDANDLSSPDGLYFDQRTAGAGGLLWIQTDDGAYLDKTNCMMLAAIPGKVGDGGEVSTKEGQKTRMGAKPTQANLRRFLVGPVNCEITGVVATPDGKTLFFNVQHPGEAKADFAKNEFTSYWPGNQADTKDAMHAGHKRPRSATVVVTRKDGGTIGVD